MEECDVSVYVPTAVIGNNLKWKISSIINYLLSLSSNYQETGDGDIIPLVCDIILKKDCKVKVHKERFNKERIVFRAGPTQFKMLKIGNWTETEKLKREVSG